MDLIVKISKGSKMDQIYLPKNRIGLPIGQYVTILPLEVQLKQKSEFKPYFYNVRRLEPLKIELIEKIFNIVEQIKPENIIITGSFLEKGFRFNDIDILIIKNDKIDYKKIQDKIEDITGIKTHIIGLSSDTFFSGLSIDPLYRLMISKCVSKKRLTFKLKRNLNYKLLDYQLLKSDVLPDNFDFLTGDEKYYLTRSMIAILLFVQNKKLTKKTVDAAIESTFKISVKDIKENFIDKKGFNKIYKEIYNNVSELILERIHESK